MKKLFCDICGEPADDQCWAETAVLFGDPYERDGKAEQCTISARLVISFKNHKQGYGGPPDLCLKCVKHLIGTLTIVSR